MEHRKRRSFSIYKPNVFTVFPVLETKKIMWQKPKKGTHETRQEALFVLSIELNDRFDS